MEKHNCGGGQIGIPRCKMCSSVWLAQDSKRQEFAEELVSEVGKWQFFCDCKADGA